MAKTLIEMAAEITTAQASHSKMSAEETEEYLKKTFEALKQMKRSEEAEQEHPEIVSLVHKAGLTDPRKSIQRNKVICLECGQEFKVLTNRHLKEHGLNAKEYRKKYGFSARQPLSAKTLSAKRRKVAKDLGLGQKLQAGRQAKAKKAAPVKKAKKSKAKG